MVVLLVLVDFGRGCYYESQWILEGNDIIGYGGFQEIMILLVMVILGDNIMVWQILGDDNIIVMENYRRW